METTYTILVVAPCGLVLSSPVVTTMESGIWDIAVWWDAYDISDISENEGDGTIHVELVANHDCEVHADALCV